MHPVRRVRMPTMDRLFASGATSAGGIAIFSSRYRSLAPHCTCTGTGHAPTSLHRLCAGPAAR